MGDTSRRTSLHLSPSEAEVLQAEFPDFVIWSDHEPGSVDAGWNATPREGVDGSELHASTPEELRDLLQGGSR